MKYLEMTQHTHDALVAILERVRRGATAEQACLALGFSGHYLSSNASLYPDVRAAFDLAKGDRLAAYPGGVLLDELPLTPLALNPAHLRPRSFAALTPMQVIEIKRRLRAGVPQSQLATRFSVGKSAIQHIAVGRTWGWLSAETLDGRAS